MAWESKIKEDEGKIIYQSSHAFCMVMQKHII